jgi:hypothetical protein
VTPVTSTTPAWTGGSTVRINRPSLLLAAALVVAPIGAAHAAQAARPDGPQPYYAPPFRSQCTVHHFREGRAPDPAATQDDPLCVEYSKRDITLDNGGAVRFLRAEPNRFAVALDKCAYWQQDHWSVQASRGRTAVIRWDGSYWFDKGTGQAGGRLRHLTIGGRPASLRQAARAVAPYSPELAGRFRAYSRGGDGMGWSGSVPFDPRCA